MTRELPLGARDAAARAGIPAGTWKSRRARGHTPEPDGWIDNRTPVWWSDTIDGKDKAMTTSIRTTGEIFEDICAIATQGLLGRYAKLGKLWREMARAADQGPDRAPGWAVAAAALLADDYDRQARENGCTHPAPCTDVNCDGFDDYASPVPERTDPFQSTR